MEAIARRVNQSHGYENQQFLVFSTWLGADFLVACQIMILWLTQNNRLAVP